MGELIEFKKGQGDVWDDAGEAFPDEEGSDSPRPGLLILPILMFLDGFSLLLALVCRPIAATPLILGGAAVWAGLRDLLGLSPSWALWICLAAWLGAHIIGRNIDQLIKAIEGGEAALMRRATQRSATLGRLLHIGLYLYVAAAPVLAAALFTGWLPAPFWLPPALRLPPPASPAWLLPALAFAPAGVAVATRYYWHPVARHATLWGGRRKFTVAAQRAEAA
jgi:hypothetical protein